METFMFSMVISVCVFIIMSLGVLITNKPIKGSCGGLNALFGKSACDICESKDKCVEKNQKADL